MQIKMTPLTPAPPWTAPAPQTPRPPSPPAGSTPPPAPQPGTPVSIDGDPPQFLTWDGGSGPTRDFWSQHLQIRWQNRDTGDWLDAMGGSQGTVPFTTVIVSSAARHYDFDITALAARWLSSGENKGAFMRVVGGSAATFRGRYAVDPAHRPVLLVKTDAGEFVCPVFAVGAFSKSSFGGIKSTATFKAQATNGVIPQFDLSAVTGTVQSAVMRLYCSSKSSGKVTIQVYECDAPRFQLGAGGIAPTLGIAAQHPGDAGLSAHPDVIRAGDFSDMKPGVLFDSYSLNGENNPWEQLPDPDAPGTVMFRGSFLPGTKTIQHGSFTGTIQTMDVDRTDPLRPVKAPATEELFCRMYVYLEDDWNSVRDANKMAMGWDLRLGWWNDAQGGYFQRTTGNGGQPGTGLKVYAPKGKNGGSQRADRWEYQGHSIRMEAGKGVADGNPYTHLRPAQSYTYHIDQPGRYGSAVRLGRGVIGKGRWHCIEQQIKMNSIVGPYDAIGNGQAVADGVLRTWLDGVLCSEITDFRWRRHPEMGVEGPWVCWYYGGKQLPEAPMHYRMNHVVLARSYIGPRV